MVKLEAIDGRRWVRIEPDQRHIQAAALETSPELKVERFEIQSGVMRASFLSISQQQADVAETVKRLAQGTSKPRTAHWEMLKRLARYLIKTPNISLVYHQQRTPDFVRISVDSDFAGANLEGRARQAYAMFVVQAATCKRFFD